MQHHGVQQIELERRKVLLILLQPIREAHFVGQTIRSGGHRQVLVSVLEQLAVGLGAVLESSHDDLSALPLFPFARFDELSGGRRSECLELVRGIDFVQINELEKTFGQAAELFDVFSFEEVAQEWERVRALECLANGVEGPILVIVHRQWEFDHRGVASVCRRARLVRGRCWDGGLRNRGSRSLLGGAWSVLGWWFSECALLTGRKQAGSNCLFLFVVEPWWSVVTSGESCALHVFKLRRTCNLQTKSNLEDSVFGLKNP